MAEIFGRQVKLGYKIKNGSTWGTASAVDKAIMVDNFSGPRNVTKLTNSPIGSGLSMLANMEQGAFDPQFNLSAKLGYNNGIAELLATFFGTAASPGTEITA